MFTLTPVNSLGNAAEPDNEPLKSVSELIEYFHDAGKPESEFRVGTELEMIGVSTGDDLGAAVPYGGGRGVRAILDSLTEHDWQPVREGETVIALSKGDEAVTIEPGGQLELASRPVKTNNETREDFARFFEQLSGPSAEFKLGWLGLGFRPWGTLGDVPWMPKRRYDIMREYLPTRGKLAHEMMKRTATVQTNLDFGSAADAKSKFRCSMSVTSILTALYANSGVSDGKINGYQSYRSRIWRDTDPDRCGLLEFAWGDGDLFEQYVQWALDVPLFFIHRGDYIFADGFTFRKFMDEGFRDYRATMDDWVLHLSTLFPEARLKRFIEVRSCDSGSAEMVLALGPLCRGFLYSDTACSEATALTAHMNFDQRNELVLEVARRGLAAKVPGKKYTVRDLAAELVAIADDGLSSCCDPTERAYLDPLRQIADSGRSQADQFIDMWNQTDGDPRVLIQAVGLPGLGGLPNV